jgi:hypothetical protein
MKRRCKGARRLKAAGQSGRKRPTRAPDGDTTHPLLHNRRLLLVAEFQCNGIQLFRRRSSRELPHNKNGKHRQAKASACDGGCRFNSCGRWQPVGRVEPRESVSRHDCRLGWKRALVLPLPCLGNCPGEFFSETVATTATAAEVPMRNSGKKTTSKPCRRYIFVQSSAWYYCKPVSPLVRFLARSISVTAIRISARVLRSGASSIACFSGGP